jgi:hypothetical protein
MQTITVNRIEREVPQSFEEMTSEQLLVFVRWLSKGLKGYDLRLKFMQLFWKLPVKRLDKLNKWAEKHENQEAWEHYQDCMSKVEILAKEFSFLEKNVEFLKCPLNRLGLGLRLRLFNTFLYGPADEMKNLTIWEWALAEQSFMNNDYNRLVGILYRRKKRFLFIQKYFSGFNEDVRIKFRDSNIIESGKKIAMSKNDIEAEKLLISIWFKNVRNNMLVKYPHVYAKAKAKAEINKQATWADIIIGMSGEIPGNEDKVAGVNMHTVLYRLELNAIKYEEFKRNNKV